MTNKQKLAQNRNYFKYILSGIQKPINFDALTEFETEEWATILNIKDELLDKFDNNSKILGLNVPEHRCYFSPCRNKVKYSGELYGEKVWFCKKHFNEYLEAYDK